MTKRQTTPDLIREAWFNGPEYVPARDDTRLRSQAMRIFMLMRDGNWRTLGEIARVTDYPEASISAQLRHFRKPRFGEVDVQRRSRHGPLHEYRINPQRQTQPQRELFKVMR